MNSRVLAQTSTAANVFCLGPESKYFGLGRGESLVISSVTTQVGWCRVELATGNT